MKTSLRQIIRFSSYHLSHMHVMKSLDHYEKYLQAYESRCNEYYDGITHSIIMYAYSPLNGCIGRIDHYELYKDGVLKYQGYITFLKYGIKGIKQYKEQGRF